MTKLNERAMLAKLSISRWTARRFDKKVSREIDEAKSAVNGGRFNKILIDPAYMRDLTASGHAIRDAHYRFTLPWDDEGPRLLPAASFVKYTDLMRDLKARDVKLRQAFYQVYPNLVQDARRRLGALYDPTEYPTVEDIACKFDVHISMTPVPDAADFRVDLSDEAATVVRESIARESEERFNAAMKECYRRLHDVVDRIHTTLSKDDPRIYDTLITNARELVECLPDLNLANDALLNELREDLARMLPASAHVLRASRLTHKPVVDEAAAILRKLKGIGL